MQIQRVAILAPLLVGGMAVICTIFIHGLLLSGTITFVRREVKLDRVGVSFRRDFEIVAMVILFAFITHLIEIGLWGVLFVLCGEFEGFEIAYYHSAVNYTTLGYGDIIMSPAWRLLDLWKAQTERSCSAFRPQWFLPSSCEWFMPD